MRFKSHFKAGLGSCSAVNSESETVFWSMFLGLPDPHPDPLVTSTRRTDPDFNYQTYFYNFEALQEDTVPVVRIRIRIWNIADPQHWLQLVWSAGLSKTHCSHWQVLPDSARLVLLLAVQEDAVPVVERTAAPCPGPGLEARATQPGTSNVADPECLSWIWIFFYPGSRSKIKKRGERGKFVVFPFLYP